MHANKTRGAQADSLRSHTPQKAKHANKNGGAPKSPAQWLGLRPHLRKLAVPAGPRTDSVAAWHGWEPIAPGMTPARKIELNPYMRRMQA